MSSENTFQIIERKFLSGKTFWMIYLDYDPYLWEDANENPRYFKFNNPFDAYFYLLENFKEEEIV